MSQRSFPVRQTDPPHSPRELLPTMDNLPSEAPEESGLLDEFHDLQPQLLSATLRLNGYTKDQFFTGAHLNLYYDVRHPLWHKRPAWFLVLGVPRLHDGGDLRSSYVVWQEGVNPFVVVELLSPGTEQEDWRDAELVQNSLSTDPLSGNGQAAQQTPPSKWQVYEQILRVPYAIVFNCHTNQLRCFQLTGGRYHEQPLDPEPQIWIAELGLGLGVWQGEFNGLSRQWLRWYDAEGNWILTDAEQDRQRADRTSAQLRQVVLNLRAQGMSITQIASLTGSSEAEILPFTKAAQE